MRLLLALLVSFWLVAPTAAFAGPPDHEKRGLAFHKKPGLAFRVAQLEEQVEALTAALKEAQEVLQYIRVEAGPMNDLAGPHIVFEGANVHVRSGSGSTEDGCTREDPSYPNCANLTGLGNLILGYNEPEFPSRVGRTGSHNLVVGPANGFTSFGGFVAGEENAVTGQYSSVSGGYRNEASGWASSVSGGVSNDAIGIWSSVSGGGGNNAIGNESSVSGGSGNITRLNASSVSGGVSNEANADFSSVSGGDGNEASGRASTVSGGGNRVAPGFRNWAAGSLLEPR